MNDFWIVFGLATSLFTLLHILAATMVNAKFSLRFRLSRGMTAALLTLMGFAVLINSFEHWDEAFLYRHSDDDRMRLGMFVVAGHFASDYLWMGLGRWRFGVAPRKDLAVHHGIGVLILVASLSLRVGYSLYLLFLVTEMLPVTSGLNAWAKHIGDARLLVLAVRLRLIVLTWFRIPAWIVATLLVVRALLAGGESSLVFAYLLSVSGLLGLVSLDIYWARKCRKLMKEDAQEVALGPSERTPALGRPPSGPRRGPGPSRAGSVKEK